MDFQELMLTYGYPILFLGVLLESEAFLLAGVYLARQGYFSLPVVIGLAALASFCVTQFCFWLGYRYGAAFISSRPPWQRRYQRIERLMNRYGTGLVVGFRGLYGLRGAIPAARSAWQAFPQAGLWFTTLWGQWSGRCWLLF